MRHARSLMLCLPLLVTGPGAIGRADASVRQGGALEPQAMAPAFGAATQRPEPRSHSRGKYAAPVELHFSVPSHLTAGTPAEVRVDITPGIDADELVLDWVPGAGLALESADEPLRLTAVKRGSTYRRTVKLTASADGEYRLGAVVTLVAGASRQSRAISRRLQVGAVVARAKPALTRDAKQALIEETPARESVSKQ